VLFSNVLVVVHAEHDGDVLVGRGRGDNDLLDRRAKVGLGLLGVGEEASGFHDDLSADRSPVELRGVALGEDLDLLAVDNDGVFGGRDFILQVAEDRIVLEEMRQGSGGREVVDGDEFDVRIS
jgi:hypothetical protein